MVSYLTLFPSENLSVFHHLRIPDNLPTLKMPDIATRSYIVALKAHTAKSSAEIAILTGLSPATINRIYGRAIERGFDPHKRPLVIRDEFVQDSPRSGRPKKQDLQPLITMISKVHRDRYGREKSCADIAGELSLEGLEISATTVWRILKTAGLRKTKPTRNPGLTKKNEERTS